MDVYQQFISPTPANVIGQCGARAWRWRTDATSSVTLRLAVFRSVKRELSSWYGSSRKKVVALVGGVAAPGALDLDHVRT